LTKARKAPLERRMAASLIEAWAERGGVGVRYQSRAAGRELRDHLRFGPRGSLTALHGVGRFLRLMRAGRIRAPEDPYVLARDLERAAGLLNRCRGAELVLVVRSRWERALTLWTESGVQRIERVVDFHEEPAGLAIRRQGGSTLLRVPREQVIRYAATASESFEVVSVEAAPRSR
jgi:hypothetical protein